MSKSQADAEEQKNVHVMYRYLEICTIMLNDLCNWALSPKSDQHQFSPRIISKQSLSKRFMRALFCKILMLFMLQGFVI